jgi:hypothetical protein
MDARSGELARDVDAARYVGGAHFDPDTGAVNASAFDRQPKDTDGLSFTRTGFWSANDSDADDAQIRKIVGSRMAFGKSACFVEMNVGSAVDALSIDGEEFWFREDSLEAEGTMLANPAHALLIGLPYKGEIIGSLRSEVAGDRLCRVIKRRFPARL